MVFALTNPNASFGQAVSRNSESPIVYNYDRRGDDDDDDNFRSHSVKFKFENPVQDIQVRDETGNVSSVVFNLTAPAAAGQGLLKHNGVITQYSQNLVFQYRVSPTVNNSNIYISLENPRDFEAYRLELETITVNPTLGNNTVPTVTPSVILSTTPQKWIEEVNYLSSGFNSNSNQGINFKINIIRFTDYANYTDFSNLYKLLSENLTNPDIGNIIFTIAP